MKLPSNVAQSNVLGLDIIVNTFIYMLFFFSLKQAPLVILKPQVSRNFMTFLVGPLFLNTPVLLLICRLLAIFLMLTTWLCINLKSMSNVCHWTRIATNVMILKPLECLWHRKNDKPSLSQPHFGQSVRMRLTLPKVGTWSPLGLPQLQSSTAEGKTPRLEVFFIPLERSWSVDVQNGLAWAIWTFAAQVMGKRRARSH
jgi:hypothetical protein